MTIGSAQTLDFDLSGVEWTGTVRRSADSTAVAYARVFALDQESYIGATALTDPLGAFRLIVRTGVTYQVSVGAATNHYIIGDIASAADSTFDLYVNEPPLP